LCDPAKLMTSAEAAMKGVPISPRVFDSRVLCEEHQLPIRPRCAGPGCSEVIRRDATGRPIRLVGGAHSGKTVYSALLASELHSPTFFQTTSTSVARINGDAYLRRTVLPLARGVLAEKSSQSHKIVFRFVRDGYPAEMITLHDMPGEDTPTAPIGYHSDKTLFLINPQATSTPIGRIDIGSVVRGRDFLGVEVLVKRLADMAWLDTANEAAVQSLCNQAAAALRGHGWPNCPRWEDLAAFLLEMARTALTRPASAEEADRRVLADLLDGTAKALCDMPDFITQFDTWAETMRAIGAPVVDGRLAGHRLALVFSKADLLGGKSELATRLDALFRTLSVSQTGSSQALCAALQDFSGGACKLFLELDLANLVQKAKQQVDEVGFFFVSSLGRDTEIKVTRLAPVAAQAAPGGGHQIGGAAAAPIAPAANTPRWELTEVLARGPDGTRTPTPRGVINPLLWLLLR
jgi:hypothetical protein